MNSRPRSPYHFLTAPYFSHMNPIINDSPCQLKLKTNNKELVGEQNAVISKSTAIKTKTQALPARMIMTEKRGPSVEPWGTPDGTIY
jgi:hypothetical protein